MRLNPRAYLVYSIGATLSHRKSYECFQIGIFEGNDYRRPLQLTIHFNTGRSSILRLASNKKLTAQEATVPPSKTFICGIGMHYASDDDITRSGGVVSEDRRFTGRKGDYVTAVSSNGLRINRVKAWHLSRTGYIHRLQFYNHRDFTQMNDLDNQILEYPGPNGNGVSWNHDFDWNWNSWYPQTSGQWEFAGFFGAFEKIGFLKSDRALAKIGVVWKRMDD